MRSRRHLASIAVLALSAAGLFAVGAQPAAADGPGVGAPWVVSVGDSAISGEAGRWAGNTNNSPSLTDAGGSSAYYDNATNTAEAIPGCHRSKAAQIHIGGGVSAKNLACSGARTSTNAGGSDFKPGLDFYDGSAGQGQALALQNFAGTHNVKMVMILIGANNYNFADLVQSCVVNWLTSPSWWKNYCNDDSSVKSNFTASNVATQTTNIKNGILNIRQAMTNAGYSDSQYTLLVQTYWSPLPTSSGIRYPESGWTRQSVGGCGVWNADANWANNTALATFNNSVRNAVTQAGLSNTKIFDAQNALRGHRLCENTVGLLEEKGVASWTSPGASDKTEWVHQIRTTSTLFGPYQLQEDFHANYWGQMALRNCVRQAYNNGAPRAGACTPGTGVNAFGEPNMNYN
jgi:hypothetical protein